MLVERFARAVLEDAIAPARILAITFTERAAGELRARVRARLLAAGEREAARDSGERLHLDLPRLRCARPALAPAAQRTRRLISSSSMTGQAAGLRARAFQGAIAEWLALDGALDLGATFGGWDLETSIGRIYDERRSRGELMPQLPALDHAPDLAGASCSLRRGARRVRRASSPSRR